MENINYHLYTGLWSLSRFPPVYVWRNYHSGQFISGGYNYVTGNDSNNQPNYPELDVLLDEARFPPDYASSQSALRKALGLGWCELFINIPLFSARSYWVWKNNLLGVVNGEGVGLENNYFFLKTMKIGGGPLVYGLRSPPYMLNTIYSDWYFDYQVLDRIYETGGIDTPPYDLSIDQEGYLKDWTVSTWVDPDDSVEKTLVTRTWRNECPGNPGVPLRFTRPVTGAQGEVLNVTQHYANLWYVKQDPVAWSHDTCKDVKTVRMTGDYSMEIYWDTPGYWNTFYGTTYLAPFHTLTMVPITTTVVDESLTVDANGWTTTVEPAYWITAADDTPGGGGTPLVVGTDIDMYLDTRGTPGPHKCTIRVINPAYYSTTIEVSYLAKGNALGYTIGNQPWDQSLEGHGMYYITDHTPGAGGSATLKRNPRYWMETPPYAEIDFVRKPNGSFQVDSYDMIIFASAYGSNGTGVPDPNWFPGADVAPGVDGVGGEIDGLYDQLTISWDWGSEWDASGYSPQSKPQVMWKNEETTSDGDPTVFVESHIIVIPYENDFTVNISMNLAYKIHGYRLTVNYNSTLLNLISITEGPLLKTAGTTFGTYSEAGMVWCLCIQPGYGSPGGNGNGTLVTIHFNASQYVGVSDLDVEVDLATVNGIAWPVAHYTEDGIVMVTYKGDIDLDGDVDIFDIVRMILSYGSEEGDPEYDPACDLDKDGDVDIFDIVIAVGNYGKPQIIP